jgi:hypothetical protein
MTKILISNISWADLKDLVNSLKIDLTENKYDSREYVTLERYCNPCHDLNSYKRVINAIQN